MYGILDDKSEAPLRPRRRHNNSIRLYYEIWKVCIAYLFGSDENCACLQLCCSDRKVNAGIHILEECTLRFPF
jgi:hypothetical protein